jgi:hypothetical protein
MLLLAAMNVLSEMVAPSSVAALYVGIGYPLIILIGAIGGRRLVKTLKEKITFPRTGYVQYIQSTPSDRTKRAVTAGAVAFVVSIATFVIARGLDARWVTLGTGLIIAAFIVYFAVQIPLNRFYLLAAWAVIIGFFAAWLPVSETFQTAILLGGISLGWLAGGMYALVRYIHETQPAVPGMDGE